MTNCDPKMAICGIRVRFEEYLGKGWVLGKDDTALNGAWFKCCPIKDSTGSTMYRTSTISATKPSTHNSTSKSSITSLLIATFSLK